MTAGLPSKRILVPPLGLSEISGLNAGDFVFVSGVIYTARDKAHAAMRAHGPPVDLHGAMIYHCGPLIKDGVVISAGPTTSGRLTRYIDDVFSWGVTAMIGKGGLPGCADKLAGKAVYLAYPGGCGALAACRLTVVDAFMKDLGMAESIWKLQAFEFGPMIVAIDSHGNDLYEESKGRALREWV